jgi:hypothetical protein
VLLTGIAIAQTSWKGTTSTNWGSSSNWTNGVPTSSVDAIIGDANFTGTFQPTIGSTSNCKSLTIGNGTKASTLTVNRALNVLGNITIGSNGTITHTSRNISLSNNWINSGSYNATSNRSTVVFSGATQSISGTITFRSVRINSGSKTKLNTTITINNQITVNGTLDPNESPTYSVLGGGSIVVNTGGTILVKAPTFNGNYANTGGRTLNASSTVDYSATTINQTISNSLTYGRLRISGGTTKILAGNLPGLTGNLTVAVGILDLATFTANRAFAGGMLNVDNGATLKIGGRLSHSWLAIIGSAHPGQLFRLR